MNTIVVGIDGSDEARAALRWAVEEARLRDASVRVVHAWSLAPLAAPSVGAVPASYLAAQDIEEFEATSRELLDSAVADFIGDDRPVRVETELVRGTPARALLEAAEDADLLVVGSRGHGGFAGLLLGSVSQQCAHHAKCPVVIVRTGNEH